MHVLITRDGTVVRFAAEPGDRIDSDNSDKKLEDVVNDYLSSIRRFNGKGWTVTQHLDLCFLLSMGSKHDEDTTFLCAVHDYAEAFIGDTPGPLKSMFRDLDDFEDEMLREVVYKAHGVRLRGTLSKKLEEIDFMACIVEVYANREGLGRLWDLWGCRYRDIFSEAEKILGQQINIGWGPNARLARAAFIKRYAAKKMENK